MKVKPSLFLLAAAILTISCKSRTEEPAHGLATAPAPSAASGSVAAVEPTGAPCPLRVRRLTFIGCNPQPSQDASPECTNYELGPATEVADHGCIPGLLRLAVSGYPGRLEVALVEAKPARGGRIELLVDALLQSSSASGWTKGTELGSLLLQDGRVQGLALTGALQASAFGLARVSCPGADGSADDCLLTQGAKP